LDTIWEEVAMV